ncbi:MAG: hypothetical protein R2759_15040 [Bacteroidales bacterium]
MAVGQQIDLQYQLPMVRHEIEVTDANFNIESQLIESSFIPCSEVENAFIQNSGYNLPEIHISGNSFTDRKIRKLISNLFLLDLITKPANLKN